MSDDAPEERARVLERIGPAVMRFRRIRGDAEFHIEELRRFVRITAPEIAPDSPGRILRLLRQAGLVDYVVLNRRRSLYQFCPKADAAD